MALDVTKAVIESDVVIQIKVEGLFLLQKGNVGANKTNQMSFSEIGSGVMVMVGMGRPVADEIALVGATASI